MNGRRQRVARVAVMSIIITAALVASGVAGGGPARASGGCGTLSIYQCYAMAEQGTYAGLFPVYLSGIGADLEVDCLAVANWNTQYAYWGMWVSTDDANPNSTNDSGYGIQGGYVAGPIVDGGTTYTGFQYYWADIRPGGGGYNEHFLGWATAYQYKNITFTWLGGSNWAVYLAGNFVGESTNNAAFAGGAEIGAEMGGDSSGQVHAHAQNWQFTNGGAWSWVDPSRVEAPINYPGFVITWAYAPTAVTVHTPSDLCGTTPQIVQHGSPATRSALSPTSVRSIAAGAVAAYATGTPTSATSVRTTRGSANALYGSDVKGPAADQPVYLVQELGSFSVQRQSPNGAKHVIRASAMHIVISATTGQVLDWGIQAPGNLRSLGPVTALG